MCLWKEQKSLETDKEGVQYVHESSIMCEYNVLNWAREILLWNVYLYNPPLTCVKIAYVLTKIALPKKTPKNTLVCVNC